MIGHKIRCIYNTKKKRDIKIGVVSQRKRTHPNTLQCTQKNTYLHSESDLGYTQIQFLLI